MEPNQPPSPLFTDRLAQQQNAKPKLLICDNDETLLQLFKMLYEARGFEPIAVMVYEGSSKDIDPVKAKLLPHATAGLGFVDYAIQNAEQLRYVMKQVKPDAVLTDMVWSPSLTTIPDGKALVDEVKKSSPTIPAVIHSGNFDDTGSVELKNGYHVVAKTTKPAIVAQYLHEQIAQQQGRSC